MRIPNSNRSGISSIGLAGGIILAGIVFGELSSFWVPMSVVLLIIGTGLESGRTSVSQLGFKNKKY
jgi:hypothetical protein